MRRARLLCCVGVVLLFPRCTLRPIEITTGREPRDGLSPKKTRRGEKEDEKFRKKMREVNRKSVKGILIQQN